MKREMADKALTIILLCKFRNFVRRMWGHIVLQKDSVTIISNNCIGGVLCHDFGLRFCSPFVNTNISMEHYLQICRHLKAYMQVKLQQVEVTKEVQDYFYKNLGNGRVDFPVGKLELSGESPVLIFFQHYSTFEQGLEAWERRKERINYDNLFFIVATDLMNNQNECEDFANLKLSTQRKLLLTTDVPFEGKGVLSRCMHVPADEHFLNIKKEKGGCYYDCFPYLKWFYSPDKVKG